MARLLLLFLLLPSTAFADGADDVANKVLDYLAQGQTDAMVDYVFNQATDGELEQAPVNADSLKFKDQFGKLARRDGYRFREKVLQQEFSSHYIRQVWIVGFEKGLVRVELRLYRPNDEWRIRAFSFDVNDKAYAKLDEDIKLPEYRRPTKAQPSP